MRGDFQVPGLSRCGRFDLILLCSSRLTVFINYLGVVEKSMPSISVVLDPKNLGLLPTKKTFSVLHPVIAGFTWAFSSALNGVFVLLFCFDSN